MSGGAMSGGGCSGPESGVELAPGGGGRAIGADVGGGADIGGDASGG